MIKAITAALLLSLSMTSFAQTFTPEQITIIRANAEAGDATAQSGMGIMYRNGDGVPMNDATAVKWLTKAAEQGYAEAQYNLGVMYRNGWGVPQDDATAVKWYTKAAEQGVASAQENLAFMYAKGEGVPQDNVMAYMWWNLAAAQGDENAKENKGKFQDSMTSAQIEEAQTLSRECLAKDYKTCG